MNKEYGGRKIFCRFGILGVFANRDKNQKSIFTKKCCYDIYGDFDCYFISLVHFVQITYFSFTAQRQLYLNNLAQINKYNVQIHTLI